LEGLYSVTNFDIHKISFMKKKTVPVKLSLEKITIISLNPVQKSQVIGAGPTDTYPPHCDWPDTLSEPYNACGTF
jgi:hypothetical protein